MMGVALPDDRAPATRAHRDPGAVGTGCVHPQTAELPPLRRCVALPAGSHAGVIAQAVEIGEF
jgi:hypothetical protein